MIDGEGGWSGAFWLITLAAAASFVLTPYFVRELTAGLKRTSEAVRQPPTLAWPSWMQPLLERHSASSQWLRPTWSWLGQVVCMESAQQLSRLLRAQEAGLRVLEEGGAPPSSDDEGEQKGLLAGRATAS